MASNYTEVLERCLTVEKLDTADLDTSTERYKKFQASLKEAEKKMKTVKLEEMEPDLSHVEDTEKFEKLYSKLLDEMDYSEIFKLEKVLQGVDEDLIAAKKELQFYEALLKMKKTDYSTMLKKKLQEKIQIAKLVVEDGAANLTKMVFEKLDEDIFKMLSKD